MRTGSISRSALLINFSSQFLSVSFSPLTHLRPLLVLVGKLLNFGHGGVHLSGARVLALLTFHYSQSLYIGTLGERHEHSKRGLWDLLDYGNLG